MIPPRRSCASPSSGAKRAVDESEAEQHERRADKADYLRRKLEERAEAERRAEDEG
jgi:hypothetical protein